MRGVALLAVLTLGCELATIGPRDEVLISSKFTTEETEVILSSAVEWSVATRGAVNLRMRIGDDLGHHAIVPNVTDPTHGITKTRTAGTGHVIIRLNTRLIAGDMGIFKSVAMHELGHGMGIHGHADSGLMGQHTDWPTCIDAEAARWLCSEIFCPDGYIITCK